MQCTLVKQKPTPPMWNYLNALHMPFPKWILQFDSAEDHSWHGEDISKLAFFSFQIFQPVGKKSQASTFLWLLRIRIVSIQRSLTYLLPSGAHKVGSKSTQQADSCEAPDSHEKDVSPYLELLTIQRGANTTVRPTSSLKTPPYTLDPEWSTTQKSYTLGANFFSKWPCSWGSSLALEFNL